MTIVNWNTEWASPRSSRASIKHGRIRALDPEILCLTGATLDFWQEPGSPGPLDQQNIPQFCTRPSAGCFTLLPGCSVSTCSRFFSQSAAASVANQNSPLEASCSSH
jgi:hypothetical protein